MPDLSLGVNAGDLPLGSWAHITIRYDRTNIEAPVSTTVTPIDSAPSDDTLDCSSSSGGRWSDLMAQIDDLIEEA